MALMAMSIWSYHDARNGTWRKAWRKEETEERESGGNRRMNDNSFAKASAVTAVLEKEKERQQVIERKKVFAKACLLPVAGVLSSRGGRASVTLHGHA